MENTIESLLREILLNDNDYEFLNIIAKIKGLSVKSFLKNEINLLINFFKHELKIV